MRTLPKGEFYCGYCFVILTSFLVKAEDNLFLMRQRWSTYTDALNNLVIYPFKYLSDKSPEDRIRNKEKMQLTMTPLDPQLGAQVESKIQTKHCMGDPILLINWILFSSLEDIQWCTIGF